MNRFVVALLSGAATAAFASGALAADLIIEEPMVGVVETAGGDWDGVYIGAFTGYSFNHFEWFPGEEDVDGWLLGLNAGANFTLTDGIVAGVVGDIAWSNASFEDFDVTWVGSLRGRLGFDGGAFLPYVTAGLAFASTEIESYENTHIGWTAGAGVEFAVMDNVSVDLLYRYSDYGAQSYGGTDIDLTSHQVTVGLNWRF